jgi:beta-lactamase superfamily II metal-dependent hydrolase
MVTKGSRAHSSTMDYEIEFHPVGDGTKAGDAISVRYREGDAFKVMVIDGGTTACGKSLVEHIQRFYGADTVISHLVSTHPDSDHASGLREVLAAFRVETVWIHGLWHHADEMLPYFEPGQSLASLQKEIREAYPIVDEIIQLAADEGAPVYSPFAGAQIGPFTVLSPTRHAYVRLVPQFRRTPAANQEALEAENFWLGVRKQSFLGAIFEKAAAAVTQWIGETWDVELLKEGPCTAAENESSTVLLGQFGDRSAILTADAGVNGLHWACDYADAAGLNRASPNLIQVPHHGSRSNVSPSVLNRLLGLPVARGTPSLRHAVVSCPKDDEKHPRKMVVNAFLRRGCAVYKTQGSYIRHHHGAMPDRGGAEQSAESFAWFDQVEAYD